MYSVVEFTKEKKFAVVPSTWYERGMCPWPTQDWEMSYIKENKKAEPSWPKFDCLVLKCVDNYSDGEDYLNKMDSSSVNCLKRPRKRKLPIVDFNDMQNPQYSLSLTREVSQV